MFKTDIKERADILGLTRVLISSHFLLFGSYIQKGVVRGSSGYNPNYMLILD